MTTRESITVSLELAKELKEAGWPQEDSIFWWQIPSQRRFKPWVSWCRNESVDDEPATPLAAPTAEEVLRQLPVDVMIGDRENRIEMLKRQGVKEDKYYVNLRFYTEVIEFLDGSLANAAAKMYCYLAKNNLLSQQP